MSTRSAKKSPAATQPRSSQPIMDALELFGHRWALRVLWELRSSVHNFRALQLACGELSPTVLNARLAELREAQLVEVREGEGYALTSLGSELVLAFAPINDWSKRWAKAVDAASSKSRTR